ncbi:cation transporter [candidate division KSB1 bacterium]
MIRNIIGLFVLIAFCACSNQQQPAFSKEESSESKMEIDVSKALFIEFSVKGMTCEGCEMTVTKNINKLEGIAEVIVSHENENAKVLFDSTLTNISELSNAITEAGYTVEGYHNAKKNL